MWFLSLGFLAQLTKGCEESKIMMNKTMMEVKLDGSKHDEMKYPYIRDMMQRKIVHMQYLPTHEQIADIFTKLTL